jgi:hypothetical protein
MNITALQRNAERFAESNECLWALLGCVAFAQRLEGVIEAPHKLNVGNATRPDEEQLLQALLGVIAVRGALERALSTLASQAREPEAADEPARDALSLRELLR